MVLSPQSNRPWKVEAIGHMGVAAWLWRYVVCREHGTNIVERYSNMCYSKPGSGAVGRFATRLILTSPSLGTYMVTQGS